ncbi:MAG: hypothetical protein ACI8ZO_000041 [Flavobacteriales bacterium]|jgi:hypothetical protein
MKLKYSIVTVLALLVSGCQAPKVDESVAKQEINATLDLWHAAASEADLEVYFNYIHPNGYFLGTDALENWDKTTFYNFSKPHFNTAPAWAFKPHSRMIFFSEDGKTAWFNELLDTWMDACRGSGVMVRTAEGWKIMQYNLAMLVPNDKVQDYLKVLADTTK